MTDRDPDETAERAAVQRDSLPPFDPAEAQEPPSSSLDLAPAGEAVRITIGVNNELTNETIPPGTISTSPAGRRKQAYRHDFYNYAGLARSVILYSVPPIRVTDVTVTTDSTTFIQLACGRIDPQAQIDSGAVSWSGDDTLGDRAARNLRFTM